MNGTPMTYAFLQLYELSALELSSVNFGYECVSRILQREDSDLINTVTSLLIVKVYEVRIKAWLSAALLKVILAGVGDFSADVDIRITMDGV